VIYVVYVVIGYWRQAIRATGPNPVSHQPSLWDGL